MKIIGVLLIAGGGLILWWANHHVGQSTTPTGGP